jgi:peptide/nickel transport system substrate-binding protein
LDPFSAMAALRSGEVDWWEVPPRDLAKGLARERDIAVIPQYATAMGVLRFNHLHPPFDNAAVRRALLSAVDQAEAMTAVAGTDHAFWHDGESGVGSSASVSRNHALNAPGSSSRLGQSIPSATAASNINVALRAAAEAAWRQEAEALWADAEQLFEIFGIDSRCVTVIAPASASAGSVCH